VDEMKIVSSFTKGMIAKIIKRVLKNKLGYNVDVQLNEFNTTIKDGEVHAHISLDANLEKIELLKLLTAIGLQ